MNNECLIIHDQERELCGFDRAAQIVYDYEHGSMEETLKMYHIDEAGEVDRIWCYPCKIDDRAHVAVYNFTDIYNNEVGEGVYRFDVYCEDAP